MVYRHTRSTIVQTNGSDSVTVDIGNNDHVQTGAMKALLCT